MSKDGDDLIGFRLLNQSIVDDDVLLPRQAIKVGIGVSAALRPVNDKKLLQGELMAGCELLDLGFKLSLVQRRQLIEQRLDENGIRSGGEQLQAGSKDPQVKHKLVSCFLNDLQEGSQDGRHQQDGKHVGLDHVSDEQLGSLLVETKFFLQNKRAVHASRQAKNLLDDDEAQDKENGVADFPSEP